MSRLIKGLALGLMLATTLETAPACAQERVVVTVRHLFEQGHRLEVSAGTEIVWADPHFERVWFPAAAGNPRVERVAGEFRAMFAKPGTYRGAFTVVAGHATNDVYNMIIVVKPRPE